MTRIDKTPDTLESRYPLAGLLSLTTFKRLLYLQPSGLVFDSSALDSLFHLPMNSSIVAFSAFPDNATTAALIKPSMYAYRQATDALSRITDSSSEFDQFRNMTKYLPTPASRRNLLSRSSSLHHQAPDFYSSTFEAEAAYVRLFDPEIPGPEFDIPREVFLRSRPEGIEARKAWEDLYELYRTRRMDICGLDLEPIPAVKGNGLGQEDLQ